MLWQATPFKVLSMCPNDLFLKFRKVSPLALEQTLKSAGRVPKGQNLCGAAKTLHGRETRAIRAKRQQTLAELKLLERMGKGVGVF